MFKKSKILLRIAHFLLMGSVFFYGLTAGAAEISNTSVWNTPVLNTSVNPALFSSARDWNLSEEEWASYLKLMQGPSRLWYSQLSPAAVLGLNAEYAEDQQHFAELVARQEHDKVARELIFNHAVYQAMRRLFPTEPMIKDFDKSAFNPHPRSYP